MTPPEEHARPTNAVDSRLYFALLVAILPNLVIGWLYYDATVSRTRDDVKADLVLGAENGARDVSERLNSLQRTLTNLTALKIFAVALEYQRFEGLEAYFDSVVRSDKACAGMLFVDADGRLVAHNTDESRPEGGGPQIDDAKDYWTRVLADATYLTADRSFGLARQEGDARLLLFRTPILDQDKALRGWLVGAYHSTFAASTLETMTVQLRKLKDLSVDYAVLARAAGRTELLAASGGASPLAQLAGNEGAEFFIGDQLHLCAQAESATLPRLDVCISTDGDALYAALRRKQLLLILGLLASTLATSAVSFGLMQRGVGVIRLILRKLEEMAAGNYELLPLSGDPFTDGHIAVANKLIGRVNDFRAQIQETTRYVAIAQTTQMLAHDVRKPFTLLRLGLDVLGRVQSPSDVRRLASRLVPDVERALTSVNGMIEDVMEIGRDHALTLEPASPGALVEAALRETFRIHGRAQVALVFELAHTRLARVDNAKIHRVFSNILANAVQAMSGHGRLWVRTKDVPGEAGQPGFVEFTIGNDGPGIAAKECERIFEAFFTKGKKGGTGLGLAIAKKVVSAHGGRIWCESREAGETGQAGHVEFVFTLPAAEGLDDHAPPPWKSSADLVEAADDTVHTPSLEMGETRLREELASLCRQLGRKIVLGVVDDEAFYRSGIKELVGGGLHDALEVVTYEEAQEALLAAVGRKVEHDLFVCDIDLGPTSVNGFELARSLRQAGYRGGICIHSNRSLPDDYREALAAGADAFLPKPMSRSHLLRFTVTTLRARLAREPH